MVAFKKFRVDEIICCSSQMNETRYGYESRCYEGAPAFERYDPAQCPQRPYSWDEERYHDPHLPTPMKTDQSEQETNSGPIYPRYVIIINACMFFFHFALLW